MVLGHLQTIHLLPKENGVPTDKYPRRGENTESKRERLGPSLLRSTTWLLRNPKRATPFKHATVFPSVKQEKQLFYYSSF